MPPTPPKQENEREIWLAARARRTYYGVNPIYRGNVMVVSTDVAAGVLDVCLGIGAIVLIRVLAPRSRRARLSAGEQTEDGSQGVIVHRRVARLEER